MLKKLLTEIIPTSCLICGDKNRDFICVKCKLNLPAMSPHCKSCSKKRFLGNDFCENCQKNKILDELNIAYHFSGEIRNLIKNAKFSASRKSLEALAEIARDYELNIQQKPVVIAIPSPLIRLWQRGYNHSFYIAQAIAKKYYLSLNNKCLQRKYRPQQSLIKNINQRYENMADSFYLSEPAPENVLLVDDVYTSGATLQAAAKALKAGGCKQISAFVIAAT